MQKLHFTSQHPAENFDLHNINYPFDEHLRSKTIEHSQRFAKYENAQKSMKIKDNQS